MSPSLKKKRDEESQSESKTEEKIKSIQGSFSTSVFPRSLELLLPRVFLPSSVISILSFLQNEQEKKKKQINKWNKKKAQHTSILLIESGCPLSSQNTASVISPDCLACVFHKWSLSCFFLQWTCPSLRRRHSSSISTHFVCDSLIRTIPVKVTPMRCKLKLSALLLRGTLYPWRLLLLSFPLATELSYGPRQKTTHDTILWSLWWYRFLLLPRMFPRSACLMQNVNVKKTSLRALPREDCWFGGLDDEIGGCFFKL